MSAPDQLALEHDGASVAVPAPREPASSGQVRPEPERETDRWRVSGLFVQPREHTELEDQERER